MAAKQPPPLMKKHSQTDLVSRLKTRKILGVGGEDDDGEVHRSKISQVLGNEIKFTVREPLGLRLWQFVSAVLFSGIAIMALAFPDQLYDAIFDGAQVTSKTPIRLYGGALLSHHPVDSAHRSLLLRGAVLGGHCHAGRDGSCVHGDLAAPGQPPPLRCHQHLLLLPSRPKTQESLATGQLQPCWAGRPWRLRLQEGPWAAQPRPRQAGGPPSSLDAGIFWACRFWGDGASAPRPSPHSDAPFSWVSWPPGQTPTEEFEPRGIGLGRGSPPRPGGPPFLAGRLWPASLSCPHNSPPTESSAGRS
uniref:Tumor protein p53-inducible protein 11 n=1 Tax=Equus asinus TaxID=9793 RepID=A0A9L0IDH1_EQUAS